MSFNVTATWDKSAYNAGDTITGTISGDDVHTVTTTEQQIIGPVTIPVVDVADGDTSTVDLPTTTVNVTHTTTTHDSVVIDTSTPIVDNGPNPRNWVVSANKLSISAVA